jgi:hypothetical protein
MSVNWTLNIYNSSFNCEKEDDEYLFGGLKMFLKSAAVTLDLLESLAHPLPPNPLPVSFAILTSAGSDISTKLAQLANNYVAGFLLKKIKKKVVMCDACKQSLFSEVDGNPDNALITAREYGGAWTKRLCYPTVEFALSIRSITVGIRQVLKLFPIRIDLCN